MFVILTSEIHYMLLNSKSTPPYGHIGLSTLTLSARLDSAQTARILGFQPHDIPILIAAKLFKPLGRPASNAVKYFSAVEILALFNDYDWLNKATLKVPQHWEAKNSRKKIGDIVQLAKPQTQEDSLAA